MHFAGLALNGGRKEKFYYCVLTYFANEKRWALEHVGHWEGNAPEAGTSQGGPLGQWILETQVSHLAVDFPLSSPHCENCQLICPGERLCPQPIVQAVRKGIVDYLSEDQQIQGQSPKSYEYERVEREKVDVGGEHFWRGPTHHLMSRSFKRRLKKGYVPYWNRPIDFWVWTEYYDQLLDVFNYSYDSFGHTSLMLLKHFSYLKKHLPQNLKLFEANNFITLIELLRAKIVTTRHLRQLQGFDTQATARLDLIKILENEFNLFIYDRDLELMVKSPRAFESLLLAWAGTRLLEGKFEQLPLWANGSGTNFLIPKFHLN